MERLKWIHIEMTEGAGSIGSHLEEALLAESASVMAIDKLSTGRPENIKYLLDSSRLHLIGAKSLMRSFFIRSSPDPTASRLTFSEGNGCYASCSVIIFWLSLLQHLDIGD